MKSLVIKRSIVIAGHKTSISLEDAFWTELKKIAQHQQMTLSTVIGRIDTDRRHGNLSSAIRLFVLDKARTQTLEHAAQQPTTSAGATADAPDASRRPLTR